MAFGKQEVEFFSYGTTPASNGSMWATLCLNGDQLYENYNQPVAASIVDFTTSQADTSFHTYLHWMLSRNLDNEDVLVFIRARRTGGTGTAVIKAWLDATDNDAQSIAPSEGTAWQDITLTVEPSTSTSPQRAMYLEIKTTNTDTACEVEFVNIYTVPSAPAVGKGTSGFVTHPSATSAVNEAISTDRVSRAISAPVFVTKDRPACVYSFLDNAFSPRHFKTNSTNYEAIMNVQLPLPDMAPRDYAVYLLLGTNNASGTPSARIFSGGKQLGADLSGTGWHVRYITDVGNDVRQFQRKGLVVQAKDATGGYYTSVNALQVVRYNA